MLIPVSRRQLQTIAQYKQPVQTNQVVFSNGGDELILTTGDGQVKILDYPSMVLLISLSQLFSSEANATLLTHSPPRLYYILSTPILLPATV